MGNARYWNSNFFFTLMTTLEKGQQALIKRLMSEDGWDILTGILLASYVSRLRDEPITGMNEFETLRDLHTKQGKVEGLTEFFSNVEQMNFD